MKRANCYQDKSSLKIIKNQVDKIDKISDDNIYLFIFHGILDIARHSYVESLHLNKIYKG